MRNSNALYQPAGKAGEYAQWACNFYVGCSNDCEYCYCKHGVFSKSMGMPTPQLKKCFKDENHAFAVFCWDLERNRETLSRTGIFFTFTSDPMLAECRNLTMRAVMYAVERGVPCQILTKRADFIEHLYDSPMMLKNIAWGFTLTGADSLEKNASSNTERIEAMHKLYERGYKTFASIEPVISPIFSLECIYKTLDFCHLYKIGLLSGKRKNYTPAQIENFVRNANTTIDMAGRKVYWKESVEKYIGYKPQGSMCVDYNFNIFTEEL